jgi:hypothetical protein
MCEAGKEANGPELAGDIAASEKTHPAALLRGIPEVAELLYCTTFGVCAVNYAGVRAGVKHR